LSYFFTKSIENIMQKQLTAIIEREGNGYVSFCPQLDIASQGDTVQEARENLREALELFFETAAPSEIHERLHQEVYATQLEVAIR
jgi:predicted RNase H-like HicB family nuclease